MGLLKRRSPSGALVTFCRRSQVERVERSRVTVEGLGVDGDVSQVERTGSCKGVGVNGDRCLW